jgi:hypothetical protein
MLLGALVWGLVLYTFGPAIDDRAGVSSASLLHLQMSVLFTVMLLRLFAREGRAGLEKLSPMIGWAKLLATVFLALGASLHMPERGWVRVVFFLMLASDAVYLVIYQALKTTTEPLTVRTLSPAWARLSPRIVEVRAFAAPELGRQGRLLPNTAALTLRGQAPSSLHLRALGHPPRR